MTLRIISGGQTGADRAALDWAIQHDIPHGGWCPKGRRAEDGVIPDCYDLVETPERNYRQRTTWNVRDADATLIISLKKELADGSLFTSQQAKKFKRPWLHVFSGEGWQEKLQDFWNNIAFAHSTWQGRRAASAPGIEAFVDNVLTSCLALSPAEVR